MSNENLVSESAFTRMVDGFCWGVDYQGGWNYSKDAIEKIVNKSVEAKSSLRNVLSKHPNWNEEAQMIHFEADIDRPINYEMCAIFRNWLRDNVIDTFENKYISIKNIPLYTADYTDQFWSPLAVRVEGENYQNALEIFGRLIPYSEDCLTYLINEEEVDAINHLLENDSRLDKVRVVAGQKRAKAVSKICRALGYTEHEKWDEMFPKFGDAISPMKIRRHTAISINAVDYLTSSNGENWSSCHNPNCKTYEGQNCAGVISYALDNVTVCMYTVSGNYDSDLLERKPKFNRMMIYVSPDFKHFVCSKCYPEAAVSKSLRDIFKVVFAECLGVPNYWAKNNNNLLDYIEASYGNCAYEDWQHQERNCIAHIFHKSVPEDERENLETIYVGEEPICIECGSGHTIKDSLSCCHSTHGEYCETCGAWINDPEDDAVWSEYHNRYGCRNCMTYSDYDSDWYDNDEVEYVDNYGGYVSRDSLENSGDFFWCDYCNEWHYLEEEFDTPYDGIVCSEGLEYYGYVLCADCDEPIKEEEAIEIAGDLYCKYCGARRSENEAS